MLRRKRAGALFAVAAVVTLVVPGLAAGAAEPQLFRLHDARIDEASGIARGIASPGVFYVQNDSGDSARFFALDASSGEVRAVYTVPDAHNVDWEDLAVARDAAGVPSIWLADIGDNNATRVDVEIYRVDEPSTVHSGVTHRPQVWRLRYPSGPVNAESLAVTPGGRPYIVTKSATGRSVVYAVPPTPSAQVQTLRRVAAIRFRSHGGLIPARLQVLATGAAVSPDGRLLVVRTYTDAYVWRLSGDVAAALRNRPVRVVIPLQPQGEGVCFDGNALVLDSEGAGSPVDRVPLPAALLPEPTTSPSTATDTQRTRAPSAVNGRSHNAIGWIVGGISLATVVGVLLVLVAARRRRGRG